VKVKQKKKYQNTSIHLPLSSGKLSGALSGVERSCLEDEVSLGNTLLSYLCKYIAIRFLTLITRGWWPVDPRYGIREGGGQKTW